MSEPKQSMDFDKFINWNRNGYFGSNKKLILVEMSMALGWCLAPYGLIKQSVGSALY